MRASADVEDLAGDEIRVLGDEELDGSGHIMGRSDTSARDLCCLNGEVFVQAPASTCCGDFKSSLSG